MQLFATSGFYVRKASRGWEISFYSFIYSLVGVEVPCTLMLAYINKLMAKKMLFSSYEMGRARTRTKKVVKVVDLYSASS